MLYNLGQLVYSFCRVHFTNIGAGSADICRVSTKCHPQSYRSETVANKSSVPDTFKTNNRDTESCPATVCVKKPAV